MNTWVPITYRGYWDVPRIFLARYHGDLYLFDCAFSEELDDYPDDYAVFRMPAGLNLDDLPQDWTTLSGMAVGRIGIVPVTSVRFDDTRRKQFDASVLDALTARPAAAPG